MREVDTSGTRLTLDRLFPNTSITNMTAGDKYFKADLVRGKVYRIKSAKTVSQNK